MRIADIMEKMLAYSQGDFHDIDHLLRVWAYAKTIGELEGLDGETQTILEIAAIVHDIACPLCREKYGNTNGKLQEREGVALAADFLQGMGLTPQQMERIQYLVGHHHTLTGIDGPDYQILVEADYLANASENGWPASNVARFASTVMRTASGRRLARELFLIDKEPTA